MKKTPSNTQVIQEKTSSAEDQSKKTSQEQERLQTLEQIQEDLEATQDKYFRLYSEFENFRKRATKEKLALIENASEGVLRKLLPIVDDFERALEALQPGNENSKAVQEGMHLIHEKLVHLLQQEGVQSMSLDKGAAFDAELHEAVTKLPAEDTNMQGKILDVVEKGYLLKEKVLRFAKVVIGA